MLEIFLAVQFAEIDPYKPGYSLFLDYSNTGY